MKIKPGMLCYLVRLTGDNRKYIGRVVTVEIWWASEGVWRITADWCVQEYPSAVVFTAATKHLRPISDPDIDTTEKDDAELDNILDLIARAHQPEAV